MYFNDKWKHIFSLIESKMDKKVFSIIPLYLMSTNSWHISISKAYRLVHLQLSATDLLLFSIQHRQPLYPTEWWKGNVVRISNLPAITGFLWSSARKCFLWEQCPNLSLYNANALKHSISNAQVHCKLRRTVSNS